MNKRNCPVCGSNAADIIMTFTAELLAEINPTYRIDEFKAIMSDKEHMLTYSKCRKCKMVYCETLWDGMTLKKVYDDVIDHEKSKEKTLSIRKRMSLCRTWMHILRIFNLMGRMSLKDVRIIDYGCGWGDFLDTVHGFGINVIGFDNDSIKSRFAEELGYRIVNNVEELELFAPVDVFIMNSVLEHLQDVNFIMDLAKKVLGAGGLLVLGVMDYRSRFINRNIRQLRNNLPALTKNLNPVEHVNIYDYKSVVATLEKFKFRVISTEASLSLSDAPLIRDSLGVLRAFNYLERLSTKIIKGRNIGITVYAVNNK